MMTTFKGYSLLEVIRLVMAMERENKPIGLIKQNMKDCYGLNDSEINHIIAKARE